MRKLILILAVLAAAALAAAGCGNDDEAASGASELVPASAAVYGEATLEPEGDQKEAIESIVAKFPGEGDAGTKLANLIDKASRESDSPVSFKKDVEPWLGDEVAFFASDLGANGNVQAAAALVATEDEDKALETVEKAGEGEVTRKTYKDVEYMVDESDEAAAVFDGFVVLGSEPGVKAAIDARDGAQLSDDERYQKAIEDAADDRLGLFYVNSPELLKSLRQAGTPIPDSFKDFFEQPFVATLDADDDGVTFEATLPEQIGRASLFGQGSELLSELPADSWLALGQTDLGKLVDYYIGAFAGAVGGRDTIAQQLKATTGLDLQKDVIDWMGDYGVFVRGTSVAELDGALIVETKDEAASGRFLAALQRLAKTEGGGSVQIAPLAAPGAGDDGFTVKGSGIPKPVHVFQRGGRVVFAYGDSAAADAVDADEKLGDASEFTATSDSLGDYDVSIYVLMQPIFDLVDSTGAASDADWQDAKPYLEPLSALVGGTSGDGGDLKTAVKLVIK